jgi:integrase/recombinase XerD
MGPDAVRNNPIPERSQEFAHGTSLLRRVTVVPENGNNGQGSVAAAMAEYLKETRISKKPRTFAAYSTALGYFVESCPKIYLAGIDRKDLLRFCGFLREEKEQAPRSIYNKFEIVMTFLKANGIRGLVGKNDWPRYVEEDPEIYSKVELETFFAACDPQEKLWYEFFLMTGEREQEVMYTYWSDIKFAESIVRVTHKPDRDWTPKT